MKSISFSLFKLACECLFVVLSSPGRNPRPKSQSLAWITLTFLAYDPDDPMLLSFLISHVLHISDI